jgi:hypothetical protein
MKIAKILPARPGWVENGLTVALQLVFTTGSRAAAGENAEGSP